jgi:hypothetical protein|nr:MAG TPA: hypothetical protein [Caudoviricetes sp.]
MPFINYIGEQNMLQFIFNIIIIAFFTTCTIGFVLFNFLLGSAIIKGILTFFWGGVKWLFGF